jgi:hypothetical protein
VSWARRGTFGGCLASRFWGSFGVVLVPKVVGFLLSIIPLKGAVKNLDSRVLLDSLYVLCDGPPVLINSWAGGVASRNHHEEFLRNHAGWKSL